MMQLLIYIKKRIDDNNSLKYENITQIDLKFYAKNKQIILSSSINL